MPIYEYRCSACAHEFEEWQKITDDPVKVCPKCKKRKVERLISKTSFHLKGGGWYSDLYASNKSGSKGDSGSEGKSETKSESKSETKSESKADSKAAAKSTGKGEGKAAKKAAK